MPQYDFGAGILRAVRTDVTGQTPVDFGVLQSCTFDMDVDLKPLYGRNKFPIAFASGKNKIELKAEAARINGAMYNNIYFGQTATKTQTKMAENEMGTPSAGSVTVGNAAHFLQDLGVFYQSTNLQLTLTTSTSPATVGTYYVSANGTYKFASGDNATPMLLTYTYSTTGGVQIALTNQRMGPLPTFQTVFAGDAPDGKQFGLTFNLVVASKLSLPSKQDDWKIPSFAMEVGADAAGNVGYVNFSE